MPRDMAGTATYLYCIVHASEEPSTARVPRGLASAGRPLTSQLTRSMWLVTANVPLGVYGPEALQTSLRDVQWVADVALAHERVVEFFAAQAGATVIPMKLFTMFSSERLALSETRLRVPSLEAVIDRIAGCEEWGVRITRQPVKAAASYARVEPASGTEFLAAKKAARDVARQSAGAAAQAAEEAYAILSAIARDARRRDAPEGATTPPLLDAAFLVPADQRKRFKAAVKKLADARTETLVTLTGPWPSYNFIDVESTA
jgi:gas vesicle protein GvpL/GvpF